MIHHFMAELSKAIISAQTDQGIPLDFFLFHRFCPLNNKVSVAQDYSRYLILLNPRLSVDRFMQETERV
jgi:hypothetical protein